MKKENKLSEKWIKASILGTMWAASEIVLGSFLHNLKVPFSGHILTAIAIIILISVNHLWNEKGLFWRAGLICAFMKTISPSAVIFGPMIAIISEAILLEISVTVLGRNFAGYILGAVLAMSWNLFQQIANYIVYYGFNIVDLYTKILKLSQKQLNLNFDILWLPIIILLFVHVLFGSFSALAGMKIGKRLISQPPSTDYKKTNYQNKEILRNANSFFNYSLWWLYADIILIVGLLIILSYSQWYIWSSLIAVIIFIWILRYKKALNQLLKPKFWIFFIFLTMLTALIFSGFYSSESTLADGLLIGFQMNFRAAVIIAGFSVLGTELYNPKIREYFLKTSFKQLPLALELSFESLPAMIAAFPDFKSILKKPIWGFYQVVSQADISLAELKNRIKFDQKVFILTGGRAAGKTTQLQKILAVLKENNISAGGIYSPKIIENGETIGYDIINISTNEREIFLRKNANDSSDKIGEYSIYSSGLKFGKNALTILNNLSNKIVAIDEVGNLELNDDGWAGSLQNLNTQGNNHILLVVRDCFLDKIVQKWNFKQSYIYNITATDTDISRSILEHLE